MASKKMGGKLGPVGGTTKGPLTSTPFKDNIHGATKGAGSKR
jgi:hypothetical protein